MKELLIDELKDWQNGARRALERDIEQMKEELEQKANYLKVMEVTDELIADNRDLKEENERLKAELDDVMAELEATRQQLQVERDARKDLEVKFSELNKLSAGVAKKSAQDDFIKALRKFLNISKRKAQSKREAAKMVITEMITSAQLELPEDLRELLDHLDDEQPEPKVITVTGNYNDIHDNDNVKLDEDKCA